MEQQQIRLTAKRQATLPKALCQEMNLQPGDSLLVERVEDDGEVFWRLRPAPRTGPEWFGALQRYAKGTDHGLASIRESIEKARSDERF